jgi:hypothetical protein
MAGLVINGLVRLSRASEVDKLRGTIGHHWATAKNPLGSAQAAGLQPDDRFWPDLRQEQSGLNTRACGACR